MSASETSNQEMINEREQALNAILNSIALEETALGNIMAAESEKIQYTIDYIKEAKGEADAHALVSVNQSVAALLEQISDMQLILKNKMRLASNCLPCEAADCAENPAEEPCKPCDCAPPPSPAKPPRKPARHSCGPAFPQFPRFSLPLPPTNFGLPRLTLPRLNFPPFSPPGRRWR